MTIFTLLEYKGKLEWYVPGLLKGRCRVYSAFDFWEKKGIWSVMLLKVTWWYSFIGFKMVFSGWVVSRLSTVLKFNCCHYEEQCNASFRDIRPKNILNGSKLRHREIMTKARFEILESICVSTNRLLYGIQQCWAFRINNIMNVGNINFMGNIRLDQYYEVCLRIRYLKNW